MTTRYLSFFRGQGSTLVFMKICICKATFSGFLKMFLSLKFVGR